MSNQVQHDGRYQDEMPFQERHDGGLTFRQRRKSKIRHGRSHYKVLNITGFFTMFKMTAVRFVIGNISFKINFFITFSLIKSNQKSSLKKLS